MTSGHGTHETVTDDQGRYVFEDVPFGSVTLELSADQYEKDEWTVQVTPDAVEPEPRVLVSVATGSQLRGLVRSYNGKGLRATVTVAPIGLVVETDASGFFEIDLEPGMYTVEIEAIGYRKQTRTAEIEKNSVNILNVDLRRKKR